MFVGLLVCLIRNGTPSRRQVDSEHGYMMFEFDKSCVYTRSTTHWRTGAEDQWTLKGCPTGNRAIPLRN